MASVFRQFPDDTLAIYDVEGGETLACVEDVVGEQVPVVVSEFWEVVLDLEVNDAVHAQSVDNLTLTIVETLIVQDAVHAQSVDSLTLTIVETLSVQDATHEQSVENVTLITQTFAVADATHALSSDNVVLEQVIYKLIDAIVVACERVSSIQVVASAIAGRTNGISQITEITGVLVEVSERTHVSTHIEVKAEYE